MSFKEYASKNYVLEKLASLGSPVTSWNDLTDKPFGEGDVLYRFGQEDIIETIGRFAKINNEPANYEETFFKRTYILYSEDGSVLQTGQIFNQSTFSDYPGVYAVEIEIGGVFSSIYVVAEDNTELFGSTLSKGIWVDSSFVDPTEDGIYLTEIIDLDKTLDEKYIPDTIARVTDILTSWNDLTDKPFGDGDKIYEWLSDIEYTEKAAMFVKVSDDAPDKSDVIGGKLYADVTMGDDSLQQELPIEEDMVADAGEGAFAVSEMILVVTADTFDFNGSTLTKGVWMVDFAALAAEIGITYNKVQIIISGDIKTLDEKYIPDTIARVADIEAMLGNLSDKTIYVEWNVNGEYEFAPDPAGDALVKLSDDVPSADSIIGATFAVTLTADGETATESTVVTADMIVETDYGYVYGYGESSGMYFVTAESATIADTVLTRGIWSQNLAKMSGYVEFKIFKEFATPKVTTAQVGQTIAVKAVDENGRPVEWEAVDMPDTNTPKNELVLNSSTEGSSKQFKITIDDAGTLTVSEIVEEVE